MKTIVKELQELIAMYSVKFNSISESEFTSKPASNKWSKKEIVGHLIDSAQNNLRRFIVGQYETTPPHIVYDQDFWVDANGYQHMSQADIINLWKLVNERICAVLEQMSTSNYSKQCNTGKGAQQLYTLEWLAEDYVKHMRHHVNQILPGSFDVRYQVY